MGASFWADHGDSIYRAFALVSVIVGFAIMIYKQGKSQGQTEASISSLSVKIQSNCNAIAAEIRDRQQLSERFENELHSIEKARFVTHDQHAILSKDCVANLDKAMNEHKIETNRRFGESHHHIEEINRTLKEMEKGHKEGNKEYNEKLDKLTNLVLSLKHNNVS